MAWEIPGFSFTRMTGEDLSASQYRFVKESGLNVIRTTVIGERVMGVVQNKPANAQAATIVVNGVTKVTAGAVVAAGAKIATAADGRAITAVATNNIVGIALEAASAAGVLIPVLLVNQGVA